MKTQNKKLETRHKTFNELINKKFTKAQLKRIKEEAEQYSHAISIVTTITLEAFVKAHEKDIRKILTKISAQKRKKKQKHSVCKPL